MVHWQCFLKGQSSIPPDTVHHSPLGKWGASFLAKLSAKDISQSAQPCHGVKYQKPSDSPLQGFVIIIPSFPLSSPATSLQSIPCPFDPTVFLTTYARQFSPATPSKISIMFANSIRSAIVVAVAFSEIALAATTSGRRTLALSPRDQYSSEEYKSSQQSSSSIQQMGAVGQFGASQQSASSYMSYESHQIVSTWSRLPAAFSQCQSVFQRRVETSVAIEAVQTLYTQFQAISQYSSCSCGQATIDESHTAEFTQMITQVFTYWQSILTIGHEVYGSEWDSQFRGLFERFTPFVSILKGLSVSLQINLSALLIGLHLDLNVFGIIGIDLNVIIGGLGPLVGGVLGTVGNVVGGLVGGNGLLGNGLLGLGGSKGLLRE